MASHIEVKPFEYTCQTCGHKHERISVQGLIPMTIQQARRLAYDLNVAIGDLKEANISLTPFDLTIKT